LRILSILKIFNLFRDTFDRFSNQKGGFQEHIKKHHYMWNYLFFIVYLQDKDPVEYTGIESYVSEKLKNNDIYWFPI